MATAESPGAEVAGEPALTPTVAAAPPCPTASPSDPAAGAGDAGRASAGVDAAAADASPMGDKSVRTARPEPPPGMSRKAWKRQLRWEAKKKRRQEHKALKRAAAKASGAVKRQRRDPAPTDPPSESALRRQAKKEEWAAERREKLKTAPHIVMDCDFWERMHLGEQRSICMQLIRCYGFNKREQKFPLRLSLTGVCDEMLAALGTACQHNLDKMPWWTIDSASYETQFDTSQLVYLTADADTTITTLDPSKVYIIGAIIDRNRHKGITKKKADAHGIATARLPLEKYVKMMGSQVLTTNSVFEMLLKVAAGADWEAAVRATVPTRKVLEVKAADAGASTTATATGAGAGAGAGAGSSDAGACVAAPGAGAAGASAQDTATGGPATPDGS